MQHNFIRLDLFCTIWLKHIQKQAWWLYKTIYYRKLKFFSSWSLSVEPLDKTSFEGIQSYVNFSLFQLQKCGHITKLLISFCCNLPRPLDTSLCSTRARRNCARSVPGPPPQHADTPDSAGTPARTPGTSTPTPKIDFCVKMSIFSVPVQIQISYIFRCFLVGKLSEREWGGAADAGEQRDEDNKSSSKGTDHRVVSQNSKVC